jgi:hypothetical protein
MDESVPAYPDVAYSAQDEGEYSEKDALQTRGNDDNASCDYEPVTARSESKTGTGASGGEEVTSIDGKSAFSFTPDKSDVLVRKTTKKSVRISRKPTVHSDYGGGGGGGGAESTRTEPQLSVFTAPSTSAAKLPQSLSQSAHQTLFSLSQTPRAYSQIQPSPPPTFDPTTLLLVYSINTLSSMMSDWISRLTSFIVIMIYVVYYPEASCNGQINVTEAIIRGCYIVGVGFVMDFTHITIAERILKYKFSEGAAALCGIRLGWRTFALVMLLILSVVGGLISMEGSLVGEPNECFI